MNVKQLIERLESYDKDMNLKIRVFQNDGWKTNWANTKFELDNIFSWTEDVYIDTILV